MAEVVSIRSIGSILAELSPAVVGLPWNLDEPGDVDMSQLVRDSSTETLLAHDPAIL